ncbi:epoxide hydrolase a [Quercus suber]|uniref:Epoxide hydrolase a n=1 Tax=Quercus suber TaxID=58331 RepID=A0AAW0KAR2_QUESU
MVKHSQSQSTEREMEGIEHRTVNVNGINMHIAEKGQGPVILFIHGFPELWYSWRHQIIALASQGYRAVAPDLRGYGDTDAPPSITSYTCFHVVGDLIALLDAVAPDQDKVFVVGHDWGALIAWYLCLFRPDRVKALVNMSVVLSPRNPKRKPLDSLTAIYGNAYYMCRFQEFLTYRNPGPLFLPKGEGFGHPPGAPIVLPSWLNWELTAPWTGAQIKVPVKFIVGDLDLTYNSIGTKDYIHKGGFKRDVPLLEEVIVLEDVGHFLHEEKPDEINTHIYDYFQKF